MRNPRGPHSVKHKFDFIPKSPKHRRNFFQVIKLACAAFGSWNFDNIYEFRCGDSVEWLSLKDSRPCVNPHSNLKPSFKKTLNTHTRCVFLQHSWLFNTRICIICICVWVYGLNCKTLTCRLFKQRVYEFQSFIAFLEAQN